MSLPRYPEYKDSGIEWLGNIPSHWSAARINVLATLNDETLPESTDPELEIEYVDIGSVSLAGGIERTESLTFSAAPSRARRIVRHGDVLVSTVRTYLKAIAPVVSPALNLVASTGFAVVRPKSGQNSWYLKYALQCEAFVHQVIARSNGVSYPAINASDLARIPLWAPPIAEQRAIASFLDRETAKIDALIAEQEKLLALLAEKRQATISYAVTRGLDPSVSMRDSGIPWLGQVPAHWKVARLKFIAAVQTGIAKGKDISGKSSITVPYLRVANVQNGHLALGDVATIQIEPEQLDRYRLKSGDVLMNEGGDFDKLGRGALWNGEIDDCIHQNHVFAVRPHSVSPQWLNQIAGSRYAQFYFMGRSKQSTNLASISSTNIMELPVMQPPADEQRRILRFVQDESGKFDALHAAAKKAIDVLNERRSALISAAVTGQIDVRGLVAREAA